MELPIAYDGAEVGITLDPRYLSDFLRVLDPEQRLHLDLATRKCRGLHYRRRLCLCDHAVARGQRNSRLKAATAGSCTGKEGKQ